MTEQRELERLASRMYQETFERLASEDVKRKVTLLYGPPMVRPDVAVVSFQGGGGDKSPSRETWPERLLYLDDRFDFGKALRHQFEAAGLSATLENRTVAMAACFPEAPVHEAGRWSAKHGTKAEWRQFSSAWVRRMLGAMRPRAVLVFGTRASEALGLADGWRDRERRDSDKHLVYGRAEIEGCGAVYCHHLSQGYSRCWVQRCLREVKRLVGADGEESLSI